MDCVPYTTISPKNETVEPVNSIAWFNECVYELNLETDISTDADLLSKLFNLPFEDPDVISKLFNLIVAELLNALIDDENASKLSDLPSNDALNADTNV